MPTSQLGTERDGGRERKREFEVVENWRAACLGAVRCCLGLCTSCACVQGRCRVKSSQAQAFLTRKYATTAATPQATPQASATAPAAAHSTAAGTTAGTPHACCALCPVEACVMLLLATDMLLSLFSTSPLLAGGRLCIISAAGSACWACCGCSAGMSGSAGARCAGCGVGVEGRGNTSATATARCPLPLPSTATARPARVSASSLASAATCGASVSAGRPPRAADVVTHSLAQGRAR